MPQDLTGWNGAPYPERCVMDGHYVRLEPLDPVRHGVDLFRSAVAEGAPDRFRYLVVAVPRNEAAFGLWMEGATASRDPLYFAVIDKSNGRAEGRQSLMRIDSAHGVIEIGHILWGPGLARTRAATEAFYLMAAYVFDKLGYRRLEWRCDNRNEPSKRAASRFGFVAEGLFRQHMVVKGENRDTVWFAITDAEWPIISAAFRMWLDPGNFDDVGRQKHRIEDIRSEKEVARPSQS